MSRIGFIGLGNMGRPMALNLIKAGHSLTVFDLAPDAVAALVEAGATAAASVGAAASGVELVITMLPAGPQVRAVYQGPDGIIAHAASGTLLIDSSTIDVESARAVAQAAAHNGLAMIDAPVSGGTGGAAAGTLTFMVGGAAEDFARAKPVLDAMGKTIVHAGGSGNGQAAKICNNMMSGTIMLGTIEAFALAEKLGLDAQTLFDITATSSGQSWCLTTYCPVPGPVPASPANRGYAPGFTAAMMLKDLRLAQQAAMAAGATTPLGATAASLYALHVNRNGGERDFSSLVDLVKK